MKKARNLILTLLAGIIFLAPAKVITMPYTPLDEISRQARKVAKEINYEEDIGGGHEEDQWSPPEVTRAVGFGDCDDMALLLKNDLKNRGINTKFNIGWVKPNMEEGHAWLEYETPSGRKYIVESTNGRIYDRDEMTRRGLYNVYCSEDNLKGKKTLKKVEELNLAAGRKIL